MSLQIEWFEQIIPIILQKKIVFLFEWNEMWGNVRECKGMYGNVSEFKGMQGNSRERKGMSGNRVCRESQVLCLFSIKKNLKNNWKDWNTTNRMSGWHTLDKIAARSLGQILSWKVPYREGEVSSTSQFGDLTPPSRCAI